MEINHQQPTRWTSEKRLTSTLLTLKPHPLSFLAASLNFLIIYLTSQWYWKDWFSSAHLWPAINRNIFEGGEWWRAFSAIFVHSDFVHFFSNMYMLTILSFFIFGYFGFKLFPVLSVLAAALVNILATWTYPPDVRLIGASGLVYVLGGLWLTLYWFIQRQHSWPRRLLRVMGVSLVIFFPTSFTPTTSYRTHAIGFIIGVALGVLYFWREKERIQSFEVYQTTLIEEEPTSH